MLLLHGDPRGKGAPASIVVYRREGFSRRDVWRFAPHCVGLPPSRAGVVGFNDDLFWCHLQNSPIAARDDSWPSPVSLRALSGRFGRPERRIRDGIPQRPYVRECHDRPLATGKAGSLRGRARMFSIVSPACLPPTTRGFGARDSAPSRAVSALFDGLKPGSRVGVIPEGPYALAQVRAA
jgi:hypothetical protein